MANSSAPDQNEFNGSAMDLEEPSYHEAQQTFTSEFYDCADYADCVSPKNNTIIEVKANDPFSPIFQKTGEDEREMCRTTKSEYSPKGSNDYVKLCRVSPTSQTRSSTLSDWKYSSNGYPTSDYNSSKTKDESYLIDPWDYKKDRNNKLNSNTYLSRHSFVRNFDPLLDSEANKTSDSYKSSLNRLEESPGLTKVFERLKITETPKAEQMSETMKPKALLSPKPDVLAFALEEKSKDNVFNEKQSEFEDKLKEKDFTINKVNKELIEAKEEIERLLALINTMHFINEELVRTSQQTIDAIKAEKCKSIEERNEIQKNFFDLRLIYDKTRNDLTLSKESEGSYQRQYALATDQVQELERLCRGLNDKCVELERQLSSNNKKDLENEVMTSKIQFKKAEMKINSIQNQLDQKLKENAQLSAMVDELIEKVQK